MMVLKFNFYWEFGPYFSQLDQPEHIDCQLNIEINEYYLFRTCLLFIDECIDRSVVVNDIGGVVRARSRGKSDSLAKLTVQNVIV
jgi:hypothetical protein